MEFFQNIRIEIPVTQVIKKNINQILTSESLNLKIHNRTKNISKYPDFFEHRFVKKGGFTLLKF